MAKRKKSKLPKIYVAQDMYYGDGEIVMAFSNHDAAVEWCLNDYNSALREDDADHETCTDINETPYTITEVEYIEIK